MYVYDSLNFGIIAYVIEEGFSFYLHPLCDELNLEVCKCTIFI